MPSSALAAPAADPLKNTRTTSLSAVLRTTLSGTVALVTPDATGKVWLSFQARDYSYEAIRVGRPFYLTRYDVILTPR